MFLVHTVPTCFDYDIYAQVLAGDVELASSSSALVVRMSAQMIDLVMCSPIPCGYIMVFVRLPVYIRDKRRLGVRILHVTCKPQMLRIVHILREIMVHSFRCLDLSNRNVRQGRQLLSHVLQCSQMCSKQDLLCDENCLASSQQDLLRLQIGACSLGICVRRNGCPVAVAFFGWS